MPLNKGTKLNSYDTGFPPSVETGTCGIVVIIIANELDEQGSNPG